MRTTREAADMLGISPRRVNALIESGRLEAQKVGGIWLVDSASIEGHAATVRKSGGRPAAGSRNQEAKFVLKNRTHDIAEVIYDATLKEFTWIGPVVDKRRAPLGIASSRGRISTASFNIWWRNRGIPQGRIGLEEKLREFGVSVPTELMVRSLGLSLSDQYWIKPEHASLSWEDINFFNNDFDVSAAILETDVRFVHPDNTSDGNLPKHWAIENGQRVLLKGGANLEQEPYNEVIATRLHQRLLTSSGFVPYRLTELEGVPACTCPLFLSDDEEYIPAFYVMGMRPQLAHHSDYQHYVECCQELGICDVEDALARMIVCDDILANTDRHRRNFGIIRNVETLTCRTAPIFDSGTSLWCDKTLRELEQGDFEFFCKQFKPNPGQQLLLAHDLSWIDTESLEGFVDEALGILSLNERLANQLPHVKRALSARVERMQTIRAYL